MQAIAPYKNRPATSDDETEYVENLFNALCSTLMTPKNRQLFVEAEGVELMVLILKQKKSVRAGALKALVQLLALPLSCHHLWAIIFSCNLYCECKTEHES